MAQVIAMPDPFGPDERAVKSLHSGTVDPLRSPYWTYLNAQAESARSSVRARLNVMAGMLWPGVPAEQAPWHELDAAMLLQLRARLVERYRFDAAGNYLSTAKAVLKAAWLLGMATSDQWSRAQQVTRPKGHALPAGSWVTDDEWRRLFASVAADTSPAGVRDVAILAVLRGCGCRRAELVALDLADVDWNRLVLRFRTAKGQRQRESALPEWTRAPLAAYLRLRGPMPGPLFLRLRGGALSHGERLSKEGLHHAFKRRAVTAGLGHLSLHDTRRGYVSSALEAGIDPIAVARQVGHQQVQTTMRYDKRPLAQLQEMAQRMPDPFKT